MAEVIRMPLMSDTMEEGNIIGWLKQEGDKVESGELLAEVETDKATMELDSFYDGVLLHIAVKEGPVPVDGIIAVIGEEGEDWKAALTAAEGASTASKEPAEAEAPKKEEVQVSAGQSNGSLSTSDQRLKASPLAKSIAKEAGIDISRVSGTGDQGRIVKRDIEAYLSQQEKTPTPAVAVAPPPPVVKEAPTAKESKPEPKIAPFVMNAGQANYEDKPLSQMRKVIARRLGESKFSAPHFYLTIDLDMDKLIQMRKRVNAVAPVKISFNDFIVKAAAVALRLHPSINASWMDDHIRYNKDINIGVAVAVDEGLLVPVVNYADMKSLSQIKSEIKVLAGKAKERKLHPDEMSGNTFTISNLGMFGIEEFTAIINPPDACIMAVGSIVQKPVVKDGEIVVGNRMRVTMSCDHRVVDGATGAQFLQSFKEIIENPVRLLV